MLPVCYPRMVRFAVRGCAILAVVLGMAVVAPVQRVERSREPGSGITPAGERDDAPAIRTGADLGRRLAQPLPVALPPAVAALRAAHLSGVIRSGFRGDPIVRVRAGARGARAPPPSV